MESLLEGLKKHLEETPREVLEQEFFEIDCKMEGIDHTLPNAKELLKRKRRIDKWKYKILPKVYNTACWMLGLWCAFRAGMFYTSNNWVMMIFCLMASIGWFHFLLSNKLGKDYMFN